MKTVSILTLSDAKAIAAAAEDEARRQGWNVVIAIVDAGGHLVYLQRMDDTQVGSVVVAQEKARTAVLFRRPTKALEDTVLAGKPHMMILPGATPIEGGLPLVHNGQVLGAIGVSGVMSHQDGVVAKAGADILTTLA